MNARPPLTSRRRNASTRGWPTSKPALAARDIDRVVGKFAIDSFWRDLVAFTWNIKTVEGRDQIADMLGERLADTDPSGFRTRETRRPPTAT